MPLFEFECTKCRSNVENILKKLEKKTDKTTVKDLVDKYNNIHSLEVLDLDNEKLLAKSGKMKEDAIVKDYYIDDGNKLVLINMDRYRFQELIYEKEDEKKVVCECGERKYIEKVISTFAFTSDLSTDMPKPDLSNLPPSVRAKTKLTGYIEEKDRPKKNR
ncbi:MAG: hypothetical protein GTO02_06860 [Candidatus Dadabacteria bacterium]|nr:hypothetical protein [Candidatus Dadabacteria bacterium]